jgi:streptogramin lyase
VSFRTSRVLMSACCLMLSACGGGGGGGSQTGPVPVPVPTATPPPTTGNALFELSPDASSSITALRRKPHYVSKATKSIAIVANGASATTAVLNLGDPAHCDAAGKCTISLTLSPGNATLVVSAYDSPGGTGSLLSRATVHATIVAGITSIIAAVLDGNVATVALTLANPNPTLHQALTDAITVVAKDPSNNTIVGPGGYLNPITLTNSDTSGHTSLTKTTIAGPGDAAALQYDGGYAAGSITASAAGLSSTPPPAQFFPTITSTETPIAANRTARSIVVGPDGALWFAESPGYLGRISTAGALSESVIPGNYNAFFLCTGPDNALWIGAQNMSTGVSAIMRRDANGSFTTYTLASGRQIFNLVLGSDGNLWFNQQTQLGQITPAGVVTMTTIRDSNGNSFPLHSLVNGPDNALWFSTYGTLGRFDLGTHAVTLYAANGPFAGTTVPGDPTTIVVGPDGRLYFSGSPLPVMASTTTGTMAPAYSQQLDPPSTPLAFAPDGGLWFTAGSGFTTVTFGRALGGNEIPVLDSAMQANSIPGSGIDSIVLGPDGALWYARGGAVGRMVP